MKISIFVEGYTELAFVREFILRYFEYSNVDILCQKMKSGEYLNANYDFPTSESFFIENENKKFHIIDCGGDQITSKIIKREKYLLANSYSRIVGLRDVYSEEFRKSVRFYDREKIIEFIDFNNKILADESSSELCVLCFSIMEIESWYLGMKQIFHKKSADLDIKTIELLCESKCPEEIYKPSTIIEKIYSHIGQVYKKKIGQSDGLSNLPELEDYKLLYESNKCPSFNNFCNSLNLNFQ